MSDDEERVTMPFKFVTAGKELSESLKLASTTNHHDHRL
jgi:hypothetical protein